MKCHWRHWRQDDALIAGLSSPHHKLIESNWATTWPFDLSWERRKGRLAALLFTVICQSSWQQGSSVNHSKQQSNEISIPPSIHNIYVPLKVSWNHDEETKNLIKLNFKKLCYKINAFQHKKFKNRVKNEYGTCTVLFQKPLKNLVCTPGRLLVFTGGAYYQRQCDWFHNAIVQIRQSGKLLPRWRRELRFELFHRL